MLQMYSYNCTFQNVRAVLIVYLSVFSTAKTIHIIERSIFVP